MQFFAPAHIPARVVNVTTDDFDEDDNWGPGAYITTTEEGVRRWNAGIRAAKARGLTGDAAMDLRVHVMKGGDPATWTKPKEIEEDERRAKRAADRTAKRAEDLTRQVADLLHGYEETGYVGHAFGSRLTPGDVVLSNDVGRDARLPNGYGWLAVRRLADADGYAVTAPGQEGNNVLYYLRPDVARQMRLKAARTLGITPDGAREGVASPYIGADQRAMYQAVLDAEKR